MAADARVTIDSIAAGGDGVARLDGLAVFVPRTAPGDVVHVRLEHKGRYARGRVVEVERPSPLRVEPPCVHYVDDRCGGCQLQHLSYAGQLEAKRRIIGDAMQRIGHRSVEVPEVMPSAAEWRYRTKLTLALRRRGGSWIAGLHAFDRPAEIFDLRDCPITGERVVAIWRDIMAASEWLPRVAELRGAVRLLDDGASLLLEGGDAWPTAPRFVEHVPALSAVWWLTSSGRRRLVADRRVVRAPGASFAQVNPAVAETLQERVVTLVLRHRPDRVIDAYAGAGATSTALARAGVTVTAIEIDREAAGWAATQLAPPSRSIAARVEDALPAALPADVVVVNPPRTGVDERVTESLVDADARLRAVIYVSCNPATLARDIGRLPGFRIASIAGFDMFPQTSHVETVCELVREAA